MDARSLRGLAHPLRVRILGTLRADGPATATQLAERLGERSGTTSWHLRLLAEHGFIEEDQRGNGRERWWRAAQHETSVRPEKFTDDAELGGAMNVLLQEIIATHYRQAAEFVSEMTGWSPAWVESSELSDALLSLTPDELADFTAEFHGLVERYRRNARRADEQVVVQLSAFPRRGPRR